MKFNLKNRPRYDHAGEHCITCRYNKEWFEGFEKELCEAYDQWEQNKAKVHPNIVFWVRHTIKEILGEGQ